MRIVSFNANGIRAAARKGFFEWMRRHDPDVVCIQETKAQEHQLPPEAVGIEGYTGIFLDAQKKGYSGVAIYTRKKPVAVIRGLGFDDIDAEARFLRLDFEQLSICSLYVPSGTSGPARQAVKEDFLARFQPELKRLHASGKPTIICGDYNIAHRDIDVFSPKSCMRTTGFLPQERAWFEGVVAEIGWVDAFRTVNHDPKQFTWWSNWPQAWERNLGWRIDYQLVTPHIAPLVRSTAIEREARFSDHAPLTIDYDLALN